MPWATIVYNRAFVDFARHHGYHPKACRPYRAKTKDKVERPYRYIRENFLLARSFRKLDNLNTQLRDWPDTVANPGVTPPRGGSSTRLLPRSRVNAERIFLRSWSGPLGPDTIRRLL